MSLSLCVVSRTPHEVVLLTYSNGEHRHGEYHIHITASTSAVIAVLSYEGSWLGECELRPDSYMLDITTLYEACKGRVDEYEPVLSLRDRNYLDFHASNVEGSIGALFHN